ncbi:hypothetical protein HN014_04230 [Aquimarina sp. TRL1]|uniref:hypothetical protein n=1 Tax=Aquimarina sp. (strain TRL1) TaxID=2736252 RepID=UPI00158DED92|nr:hypothetical protein [Aquimarina sp. TRL1]QKX04146.1 hypothetical protein HN014_04230 [Aquimarina sp. TRL1]
MVLSKNVYNYYFNDALKNGALVVENDKGKTKLDMGIYYLIKVAKPYMKNDEVYSIIWRLTQKYNAFNYSSHRFRINPKHYEMNLRQLTLNLKKSLHYFESSFYILSILGVIIFGYILKRKSSAYQK